MVDKNKYPDEYEKATCPITKKYMECKDCQAAKDERCPYMDFDDCVNRALKFMREVVETEKKPYKDKRSKK